VFEARLRVSSEEKMKGALKSENDIFFGGEVASQKRSFAQIFQNLLLCAP